MGLSKVTHSFHLNQEAKIMVEQIKLLYEEVTEHLRKSNEQYKAAMDKHLRMNFEVRDLVRLRLGPFLFSKN